MTQSDLNSWLTCTVICEIVVLVVLIISIREKNREHVKDSLGFMIASLTPGSMLIVTVGSFILLMIVGSECITWISRKLMKD